MKRSVIIYLLIFAAAAQAQTLKFKVRNQDARDSAAIEDDFFPPDTSSRGFYFPEFFIGKKLFHSSFYDQLNTFEKFDVKRPLTIFGLGSNSTIITNDGITFVGHFAFLYIPQQKVNLPMLDDPTMSGYTVTMTLLGFNVPRNTDPSNLNVAFGFNTGQLTIRENRVRQQQNPFFSPMVTVTPKIMIGPITLALNVMYDYDITNPNWKRVWVVRSEQPKLTRFRQSGLSAFFCIGYNSWNNPPSAVF